MRRLSALVAVLLGLGLGACFACPHPDGPPLVAGRYVDWSRTADAFAGLPLDSAPVSVELDRAAETVIVTFQSEGRAVEQRYRVLSVDDGW